jgi:hypothetical protein
MKKHIFLVSGIAFLILAIVPGFIVLTVISVPAALASFIFWWCAGTKEGDMPFLGY